MARAESRNNSAEDSDSSSESEVTRRFLPGGHSVTDARRESSSVERPTSSDRRQAWSPSRGKVNDEAQYPTTPTVFPDKLRDFRTSVPAGQRIMRSSSRSSGVGKPDTTLLHYRLPTTKRRDQGREQNRPALDLFGDDLVPGNISPIFDGLPNRSGRTRSHHTTSVFPTSRHMKQPVTAHDVTTGSHDANRAGAGSGDGRQSDSASSSTSQNLRRHGEREGGRGRTSYVRDQGSGLNHRSRHALEGATSYLASTATTRPNDTIGHSTGSRRPSFPPSYHGGQENVFNENFVTPYRGRRRSLGKFHCTNCGKMWQSRQSYAFSAQPCHRCNTVVVPYSQLSLCNSHWQSDRYDGAQQLRHLL
eukprot:scpid64859/ scgid13022/ 